MSYKKSIVNNNWFMSFSDFLTLMLCFFLVIISNSFKKSFQHVENQQKISNIIFTVKKDDLIFSLPAHFKDKIAFYKVDNAILYDSDKFRNQYILRLKNDEYINNPKEFINVLNKFLISKKYGFKLISFKNFINFKEFLDTKRQFIDAKIDVSEFKMSHKDKNEIILRVYEKI